MKCDKKCKYCTTFQNSEESKLCLCSFNDDYLQVEYEGECIYSPKALTCKDCARFGEDFACMTSEAEDPVNNCPGFIDGTQSKIINMLYEKFVGGYTKEQILSILKDAYDFVEEEFKLPTLDKREEV